MRLPIALGYIHPGTVQGRFMDSVVQFVRRYEIRAVISKQTGPLIAEARNEMVRAFLTKTLATHLLMVDSDMVFEPEDPHRLFVTKLDLVGGVCMGLKRTADTEEPFICANRYRDGKLVRVTEPPTERSGPIPVAAVGTGFLLVHRKVFEEIDKRWEFSDRHFPFFQFGVVEDEPVGEDVMFCLRAKDAGFQPMLAPVRIGHVKDRVVW